MQPTMRTPAPLKKGDKIQIIAPCSPFKREAFEQGVALIKAAGFLPIFDEALFSEYHYLAGSDDRRVKELHHALSNDTRAIWVARGGYGATRLLPNIELEAIATANKWLIGFSDVTALHAAWQNAGLASLHAANVTTLGSWSEAARQELFAQLENTLDPKIIHGHALHNAGEVRGKLVGGNLLVLTSMVGTEFLPDFSNAIVFLEEINEKPYRIDRALTQLVQSGVFAGTLGFGIGQLTDCGELEEALWSIVATLAPLNVPMIGQLPFGHDPTARSVLLGADVILDSGSATLEFV
jgi:muramoyltetrapeptide carboxypeptidase